MADTSFSDYATIAAAAAALGGTIASGVGGNNQIKSQSTSSLVFPQATQDLIKNVEFPVLGGTMGEQASFVPPFLGFGPPSPFVQGQYGNVTNVVQGAARKGAAQGGITDLGPTFENTYGLQPQLIAALQGLILQRGASLNSVIPAGYGSFLAPSSFQQQEPGEVNPFQAGFNFAQGFGAVAPALISAAGAFV